MALKLLEKYRTLILWFMVIFTFIAFSSLNLYWVAAPYDAWRIYEIIFLIILVISLYTTKNKISLKLNYKVEKTYYYSLIILFILACISIYHAQYWQRATADIALYFLLISAIYTQAILFINNKTTVEKISACLAVLPLFCILFLPLAIFQQIQGNIAVWHQSFPNIRVFDDALLPCLFLLWLRPAWLGFKSHKIQIYNIVITIIVYLTSTLYLLSFLLHGARAATLSILISILISLFLYKDWKKFKLPIISIIISGILFFIITYIQSLNNIGSSPLVRTGDSGRIELWKKCISLWQQHPFWGVGGDHFSLSEPFFLVAHPHNIILQFLAEWGVTGILSVVLILPILYKAWQNFSRIPSIIFAASIAILINILLSGSMIYPLSQILNVWIFAYLISYLFTKSQFAEQPYSIHFIFKHIAMIAMIAMIAIHGKDIICFGCMSADWEGAPRFWDSGRALHLTPLDYEKMGKAPEQY